MKDLAEGPRLVGLTACYLHGKFEQPEEKKKDLERLFHGQLWLSKKEDIESFLPEFEFERVHFEKTSLEQTPEGHEACQRFLERAQKELEERSTDMPQDVKKLLREGAQKAAKVIELLGAEAGELYFSKALIRQALFKLEDRQKIFKKEDSKSDSKLEAKRKQLEALEKALSSNIKCKDEDCERLTGKVDALIQRLKELSASGRCLVFVKEVASTGPLASILESHVPAGSVHPVSGRGSMSDSVRQSHLQDFRDGKAWCIVTTDCLEEGIPWFA